MENNAYINSYDDSTAEKLPACTIRRHSKVDLNKSDMLQLLSYLEGELQARDVVVATLQAEGVKRRVIQGERCLSQPHDATLALQRDADIMNDYSFGETEVRNMYDDQLVRLEALIETQQRCQKRMRAVVSAVEKQFHLTCARAEEEGRRHELNTRVDGSILQLLQKDHLKLLEELDNEKKYAAELEQELEELMSKFAEQKEEEEEDAIDYELLAVQLLKDQSSLMQKVALLRGYSEVLDQEVQVEEDKLNQVKKAVEKEEERLMQEEAVQEKRLSEYDFQRQQLHAKLNKARLQQQQLLKQLQHLGEGGSGGGGGSSGGGGSGGGGSDGGGEKVEERVVDVRHVSTHSLRLSPSKCHQKTNEDSIASHKHLQQQHQIEQIKRQQPSTLEQHQQPFNQPQQLKQQPLQQPQQQHLSTHNTEASSTVTMTTTKLPTRPQPPSNVTRLQQQLKQQTPKLQQVKLQQQLRQQHFNSKLSPVSTASTTQLKQLKPPSPQPSTASSIPKPPQSSFSKHPPLPPPPSSSSSSRPQSSSKPAPPTRKPQLSKLPPPIPPNKPSLSSFLTPGTNPPSKPLNSFMTPNTNPPNNRSSNK